MRAQAKKIAAGGLASEVHGLLRKLSAVFSGACATHVTWTRRTSKAGPESNNSRRPEEGCYNPRLKMRARGNENNNGINDLMVAASRGDLSRVESLLREGADPTGTTALGRRADVRRSAGHPRGRESW